MLHKSIESERGRVHYWVSRRGGESRTIVFCHGLTANHAMFEKQTEFFIPDFNVITWDLPLHGLSRPYGDFSYENCAKDLCAILDAEAIEKAVLVGMSLGGYPAQMFVDIYPRRTEGLVALDTTPFGTGFYSKSDLWWLRHVALIAGWFPDNVLRASMAKSVSRTRYSHDMMLRMLEPLTKEEITMQLDIAYGGFVRENRDISLSVPVIILLGRYDKTGKVRKYCEKWAETADYPLVIIENAAHFSNGDNPGQVNAEILGFISRL